MKKTLSLILALVMVAGILAGCGGPAPAPTEEAKDPAATGNSETTDAVEIVKEAPMLQEQVAAGKLPALEERLPVASDVYVETERTPAETPSYGGILRTVNSSKWYCGNHGEEPLFHLTDTGDVEPNVAKGYDLSEDGLTYTIHLRDGMKWSDGAPFTAEDCVYYYNYILVAQVDNETGKVTQSNTTKYYNWYMSQDPEDGILKPAQVRYVDDTTFTITLYSPKPTLLQAICIDNKWMFAPKHVYKNFFAVNVEEPHWSGETDLKLIGGNDLVTLTEEQALKNATAYDPSYVFEDYHMLCKEMGYYYWIRQNRPTLRPWIITCPKTESTWTFTRNPYYWKVDPDGRQLPYLDGINYAKIDDSLMVQEMMAGNLDFGVINADSYPVVKSGESGGVYSVKHMVSPSWSIMNLQLNQTYKDETYRHLFENIDFRHALSIAVDRDEMNNILYNGMAVPAQAAAPKGTSNYIEGAPEKWIEMNVEEANKLLDGIDSISKEFNSDGYRTFTEGANKGKAITVEVETAGSELTAQAVALLAQYYKKIGLQFVESANTDEGTRSEKIYTGDQYMASMKGVEVFEVTVRPDHVATNRHITAWVGKYGFEHRDAWTPEEGSPMAEMVDASRCLVTAKTAEELKAAGQRILQSHYENTWIIGYLNMTDAFAVANNRIHNFQDEYVYCDELRWLGYAKPCTWFVTE